MREAVRDKSYQLLPLGMEAAAYLRMKRKRLTKGSYRKYEAVLDKLARYFPDLEIGDFEPPVGTHRVEEFMNTPLGRQGTADLQLLPVGRPGTSSSTRPSSVPSTATLPSLSNGRRRVIPTRETFSRDQFRAIIASQDDLRDRLALRLMLTYALRKGSVREVRFERFDHVRKTVAVFAKGGTVRTLPLPDPALWHDLERLILDTEAQPGLYLMPGRRGIATARSSSLTPRYRTTPCTTGGTAASLGRASSLRAPQRVSGCTRRGTRRARTCSTRRET